jgi:hypothetical protein
MTQQQVAHMAASSRCKLFCYPLGLHHDSMLNGQALLQLWHWFIGYAGILVSICCVPHLVKRRTGTWLQLCSMTWHGMAWHGMQCVK